MESQRVQTKREAFPKLFPPEKRKVVLPFNDPNSPYKTIEWTVNAKGYATLKDGTKIKIRRS